MIDFVGSGRGTRTPDPRIMITRLFLSGGRLQMFFAYFQLKFARQCSWRFQTRPICWFRWYGRGTSGLWNLENRNVSN